MKVKVLILVLSYNNPPYDALMRSQQKTWAGEENFDTRTIFYYGGAPKGKVEMINEDEYDEMKVPMTDAYYYMAGKFRECLRVVHDIGLGYDLIFRTNSSSYVNKKKLVEFAQTLPTEKCYAGWSLESCISGAGFFISRDCAEILLNEIDPKYEKEEDFYCGQLLLANGISIIDDKSRFDVSEIKEGMPLDLYHYRFKTHDRLQDAENMLLLHEKIKNR